MVLKLANTLLSVMDIVLLVFLIIGYLLTSEMSSGWRKLYLPFFMFVPFIVMLIGNILLLCNFISNTGIGYLFTVFNVFAAVIHYFGTGIRDFGDTVFLTPLVVYSANALLLVRESLRKA